MIIVLCPSRSLFIELSNEYLIWVPNFPWTQSVLNLEIMGQLIWRFSITHKIWNIWNMYETCEIRTNIFLRFLYSKYLQVIKPFRSSRAELFREKGVLENLAKFTRKHLCQSLYFNKVAGWTFLESSKHFIIEVAHGNSIKQV